ncbi:MAG: anhydro-N-acetylmuramic acid kinase [Proteobacteria bacterium]|nr:anhydro-N-acetylmuramic acid kinase [Pseudomonadota bacterium]
MMSGTSADGVDCCLADFDHNHPRKLTECYVPYNPKVKNKILSIKQDSKLSIDEFAILELEITRAYAASVQTLLENIDASSKNIKAIGCHGQTIAHNPEQKYTRQLVNGSLLAELTNITTVIDFRGRDIAAGGQGAPLAPVFHNAFFRSEDKHRVILNIGGMANITNLAPGDPVSGFDTGPGNCLLDRWIKTCKGDAFDKNGDWAKSGQVVSSLLKKLKEHYFFNLPPPKSCGSEQFNLDWINQLKPVNTQSQDLQATLLQLTVDSIVDAQNKYCRGAKEMYVCGGGARNKYLVDKISASTSTISVKLTDSLGVEAEWVEAFGFAWLAKKTISNEPIDATNVTGSKGRRIAGAIYPR